MIILTCPCCGITGEETEFAPGGEAHLTRFGPGSTDQDFTSYLFERRNPRGVHFERWRHAFGCGKWFHVARCTATLEVFGSYTARTSTRLNGHPGDTLASALLANGHTLVGRSFKYHRPRGIVASGGEEPNALVGLGKGDRFEPNQRATTTELFDGLSAASQNHWQSLDFDVGAINAAFSRFLPAGFYYKTFIHPRAFWKSVYEPFIRRSAGLGKAPVMADPDSYEHFYAHVDVLVVGGVMAGLAAALEAGRAGCRVLLVEQTAHLGGRALVDPVAIGDDDGPDWVAAIVAELAAMPNVTIRTRTMGAGVYDHAYALAYERVADHTPGDNRPRHRLWRIRVGRIVTATGAIERPLPFAGNDVPGLCWLLPCAIAWCFTVCRPATVPWWSPTTTMPTAPRSH